MSQDVLIGITEALGTTVLVFGGAGTAIFATGGFVIGHQRAGVDDGGESRPA